MVLFVIVTLNHTLRIRFLLINSKEYNNILNYIHNVLDTYVESGEINNIQLDTYKRELERYGL